MKITLLVVGRTVDNNITAGIQDYTQRVSHFTQFEISVIPELKNAKKTLETPVYHIGCKLLKWVAKF